MSVPRMTPKLAAAISVAFRRELESRIAKATNLTLVAGGKLAGAYSDTTRMGYLYEATRLEAFQEVLSLIDHCDGFEPARPCAQKSRRPGGKRLKKPRK